MLETLINQLTDGEVSWHQNTFLTYIEEMISAAKRQPSFMQAGRKVKEVINALHEEAIWLDKELNPKKYPQCRIM